MTILADTSGTIALLDQKDRHHAAAVDVIPTPNCKNPGIVL
jgi:predicted nucleic acid-binding protein